MFGAAGRVSPGVDSRKALSRDFEKRAAHAPLRLLETFAKKLRIRQAEWVGSGPLTHGGASLNRTPILATSRTLPLVAGTRDT